MIKETLLSYDEITLQQYKLKLVSTWKIVFSSIQDLKARQSSKYPCRDRCELVAV